MRTVQLKRIRMIRGRPIIIRRSQKTVCGSQLTHKIAYDSPVTSWSAELVPLLENAPDGR